MRESHLGHTSFWLKKHTKVYIFWTPLRNCSTLKSTYCKRKVFVNHKLDTFCYTCVCGLLGLSLTVFLANICTQKFTPFLFAKSKQCHCCTYHTCLAKIWLIKLLPSFMTKSQILFCSSLTRVVIKLNVMFNFVKKFWSLGRNPNRGHLKYPLTTGHNFTL